MPMFSPQRSFGSYIGGHLSGEDTIAHYAILNYSTKPANIIRRFEFFGDYQRIWKLIEAGASEDQLDCEPISGL